MGTIDYRQAGDMIEIIVRDFSGTKIETHRCPIRDKKRYASILRYLEDKYGVKPEITLQPNPDEMDLF